VAQISAQMAADSKQQYLLHHYKAGYFDYLKLNKNVQILTEGMS